LRRDHRPYRLARAQIAFHQLWARHFVAPQLDALGEGSLFIRPWYVRVYGPRIRLGRFAHVVGAFGQAVHLCAWDADGARGEIELGDHCLVCPGVRLLAASRIEIADDCMLASGVSVSDADWHDLRDRTRPVGATEPVRLGRNAWIGERAMITKGVTIGENAIVGDGAVVADDVPANAIVVGNPARVVRTLPTDQGFVTRAALFPATGREQDARNAYLMMCALRDNSLAGWLRATLFPRRGD
jgi:acetyltransferase-like isoleucine patch superfamily enzyme